MLQYYGTSCVFTDSMLPILASQMGWNCFYVKNFQVGDFTDAITNDALCNCQDDNIFKFGYRKVLQYYGINVQSKMSPLLGGDACYNTPSWEHEATPLFTNNGSYHPLGMFPSTYDSPNFHIPEKLSYIGYTCHRLSPKKSVKLWDMMIAFIVSVYNDNCSSFSAFIQKTPPVKYLLEGVAEILHSVERRGVHGNVAKVEMVSGI